MHLRASGCDGPTSFQRKQKIRQEMIDRMRKRRKELEKVDDDGMNLLGPGPEASQSYKPFLEDQSRSWL